MSVRIRSLTAGIAVVAVVAGALIGVAPPAQAAGVSPSCGPVRWQGYDAVCFYWGQSYNGSHSFVYDTGQTANFPVSGQTNLVFTSLGTGQWEYIGNNNGSVRNYNYSERTALFYDPNFGGPSIILSAYGLSGYQRAGSQQGQLLNNVRSMLRPCCG